MGAVLDEVLDRQHGVLTRAQALASGLTRAEIEHRLTRKVWQRVFPGVYATFSGPLDRAAQVWAAVLRAGSGAVASHQTAAELQGLIDRSSQVVHVTVPGTRHPQRVEGVVIHRSDRLTERRHPSRSPPQTTVEETVLDLVDASTHADDAMAWLARAVGSRVTTGPRLAAAVKRRGRLRHRALVVDALADIASGSHSIAELRYLRDVERCHGLPASARQVRRVVDGASRYDDVRYRRYATLVEIDGRAAHPEHARWRDMRRDNAAVLEGQQVLRYGLADIASAPCRVAAQVIEALRAGGWPGRPRRCGRARCVIPTV
jgi:alkylated DNA nucleotide flippase Atl1